jgi:hypothetical protein
MKLPNKEWVVDGPGYWFGLACAVVFSLGALGVFIALAIRVVLWAWAGLL